MRYLLGTLQKKHSCHFCSQYINTSLHTQLSWLPGALCEHGCCRHPRSGERLSDDRLLPEVATFFFAGEDTTSHTGSWTL